jgi:aspartyl-tRNA(Asn)/glutamyl-tRNA(Gln) amidotransferase subunit A
MSGVNADAYRAAGLAQLGRWLRAGDCTPAELAELALAALQARAAPLNAVATLAPERARAEAAMAAAALAAGIDLGPLQGIPYGAKDLLATTGLPTTWGAAPLRDQTFAEEATVIRLLRAAGAVLTAKLAMVELAGGAGYRQPDASLTGPGRNPWHPDHWTGGSSSGSAAAVACGALPYAIGSETWGSILLPAAYCGVVGVRPTYGLVSRRGAMALAWTMDKLGPLARSVEDCARVLEAIGVPDPADRTSSGRWFRYRPERYAGWRPRFGLLTAEVEAADPAVARAVEAAVARLERLGPVVEVALPDLPYTAVARLTISAEMASAFDDFIAGGAVAGLTAPEDRVTPYVYETITAADYLRAQRVRVRIAGALAGLLTQVDLLVAPTAPATAPRLDAPLGGAGGQQRRPALSAASNLAGLPAVSLPVGLDSQGLPIGLQLVAGAHADAALLAAAAAAERLIDWSAAPAGQGGGPDAPAAR